MSPIPFWILVVSGSCGVVGFWAYMLEYIQGRVSMSTRWNDLAGFQLEMFILATGGFAVFFITLITLAVLK